MRNWRGNRLSWAATSSTVRSTGRSGQRYSSSAALYTGTDTSNSVRYVQLSKPAPTMMARSVFTSSTVL